MKPGVIIPLLKFNVRTGDTVLEKGCSFADGKWHTETTHDYFKDKRVVLFSLPGAFTPTCTSTQLPGFEDNMEEFRNLGIDDVYVSSVNDSFVMNAWKEVLDVKHVKVIPDGNGDLTKCLGMLINKTHLGFGNRSWRFMAVINNGVIEQWWEEPGINNVGSDSDPYEQTTPENAIAFLKETAKV